MLAVDCPLLLPFGDHTARLPRSYEQSDVPHSRKLGSHRRLRMRSQNHSQSWDSLTSRWNGSQTAVLVGESGQRQSVLLTAILGLLPPHWHITSGSIRLAGGTPRPLRASARQYPRQATRPRASHPLSHLNPILRLAGSSPSDLSHEPQPLDQALSKGRHLLHAVGIPDPVGPPAGLSARAVGGMCQRVDPGACDRNCAPPADVD